MSFKIAAAILWAMAAGAQPAQQPFQARAASTVTLTKVGDTEELDITNVTYEVTPTYVPGRPGAERLLLRQTCTSQAILEEPEWGATTVLEAWPLGASLSQKPIYTIKATGTGGRTVDGSLFVIERGTGELEWRSVYQLGTGQHLFDTYVPLVGFSISREALEMRYIGFEVPPDDVADARLKQPNVVGVITYASAEGKKHEALLTAATPKTARRVAFVLGRHPHRLGGGRCDAQRHPDLYQPERSFARQPDIVDHSGGRGRHRCGTRPTARRVSPVAMETLVAIETPEPPPTIPYSKSWDASVWLRPDGRPSGRWDRRAPALRQSPNGACTGRSSQWRSPEAWVNASPLHVIYRQARQLPLLLDTSVLQQWAAWL